MIRTGISPLTNDISFMLTNIISFCKHHFPSHPLVW